ncbi:hypothetical protein LZ31DRAFT_567580 [Colletotrichum somersetense]|nr:hypothetical protein LZ31DRAFT_567580 [Colletotrichum somersetense]
MFETSGTQLLYLSALGIWGLCDYAFFNSMFARLDTVTRTHRFPDGRSLRSSYMGLVAVDAKLTLLSAFYDVLTNSLTSGPRLLFFDVNYAVACSSLWALAEFRRRGVRSRFLKYPAWAAVLCNVNGAAIALPPYLYLVCRSKVRLRGVAIPWHQAAALPTTTLAALLQPLLIFAPAWMGRGGTDLHHGCIALFQVAPVAVLGFHLGLASVLRRTSAGTSSQSSSSSKRWTVASLILAGTVASAVHFYTVASALLARDEDALLTRLFIPTRGFADPAGSLSQQTNGLPAEYAALLENVHLFFAMGLNRRKVSGKTNTPTEAQELICLAAAAVFLDPGAAGSFTLAIREARLP